MAANPPRFSLPRLRLSLRAKMLFYGVAVISLLGLIVLLLIHELEAQLRRASEEQLKGEVRKAADAVNTSNVEALTAAEVMALAQQSGLYGRRSDSIALGHAVLENWPGFTGALIAYEADQVPAAGGADDATQSTGYDAKGRFLSYWVRDTTNPNDLRLTALADPETNLGYRGVRNRVRGLPDLDGVALSLGISALYKSAQQPIGVHEKGFIGEPTLVEGRQIVPLRYPIDIGGQFAGVAGVDRSLDDIEKLVESIRPFRTTGIALISRRGRIVASTIDPSWKTQVIEMTSHRDILDLCYLTDNPSGDPILNRIASDPVTGQPCVFASTKTAKGNWTVIMRVDEAEIFEPVWTTINAIVPYAAFGLVVLLASSWVLVNRIVYRVQGAVDVARRVALGDLTRTTEGINPTTDETGQLITAISTMVTALRDLVDKVQCASRQLLGTAKMLHGAANMQETSVSNFGTSSQQITAAVKEISATAQELVRTMDDVNTVASNTAGLADQGKTGIGNMQDAMEHLSEANTLISNRLQVIADKAAGIGTVVTTITKISEQVNLLSLNAAIEAAKAGEYGQGFGVVAREIRRLADETAAAVLSIARLVKEMQGAVTSGVMQMDKFTQEVKHGVDETQQLGEQFARIIGQVTALTPRFGEVRDSMLAQSQGARQISEAMAQLTDAAQHSSTTLLEFNQAAQQLDEAVRTLNEEVAKFTLQ